MSYLNTIYEIYNKQEEKGISFVLKQENDEYLLLFSVNENGIIFLYENIKIEKSNNQIYRTNEIDIQQDMTFEEYKVLKVKFMLKFRNDQLLPVSTIFLFCEKNDKKRIFNMTILDAIELGYNISER